MVKGGGSGRCSDGGIVVKLFLDYRESRFRVERGDGDDGESIPVVDHSGIVSDMPKVTSNHLLTAGMILSGISTVVCPFMPGKLAILGGYTFFYTTGVATWASLRTVVMG